MDSEKMACASHIWRSLLDDNMRPHSEMQNRITTLGLKRLHNPPYSPDLAPSDFHLFSTLRKNLVWRNFGTNA
ncbi:hypothetical protein TNCV_5074351 [Trichonephila clavipes]|nr:hypothetical protein TNCV_5074351 [Trichonephila clavipes]